MLAHTFGGQCRSVMSVCAVCCPGVGGGTRGLVAAIRICAAVRFKPRAIWLRWSLRWCADRPLGDYEACLGDRAARGPLLLRALPPSVPSLAPLSLDWLKVLFLSPWRRSLTPSSAGWATHVRLNWVRRDSAADGGEVKAVQDVGPPPGGGSGGGAPRSRPWRSGP